MARNRNKQQKSKNTQQLPAVVVQQTQQQQVQQQQQQQQQLEQQKLQFQQQNLPLNPLPLQQEQSGNNVIKGSNIFGAVDETINNDPSSLSGNIDQQQQYMQMMYQLQQQPQMVTPGQIQNPNYQMMIQQQNGIPNTRQNYPQMMPQYQGMQNPLMHQQYQQMSPPFIPQNQYQPQIMSNRQSQTQLQPHLAYFQHSNILPQKIIPPTPGQLEQQQLLIQQLQEQASSNLRQSSGNGSLNRLSNNSDQNLIQQPPFLQPYPTKLLNNNSRISHLFNDTRMQMTLPQFLQAQQQQQQQQEVLVQNGITQNQDQLESVPFGSCSKTKQSIMTNQQTSKEDLAHKSLQEQFLSYQSSINNQQSNVGQKNLNNIQNNEGIDNVTQQNAPIVTQEMLEQSKSMPPEFQKYFQNLFAHQQLQKTCQSLQENVQNSRNNSSISHHKVLEQNAPSKVTNQIQPDIIVIDENDSFNGPASNQHVSEQNPTNRVNTSQNRDSIFEVDQKDTFSPNSQNQANIVLQDEQNLANSNQQSDQQIANDQSKQQLDLVEITSNKNASKTKSKVTFKDILYPQTFEKTLEYQDKLNLANININEDELQVINQDQLNKQHMQNQINQVSQQFEQINIQQQEEQLNPELINQNQFANQIQEDTMMYQQQHDLMNGKIINQFQQQQFGDIPVSVLKYQFAQQQAQLANQEGRIQNQTDSEKEEEDDIVRVRRSRTSQQPVQGYNNHQRDSSKTRRLKKNVSFGQNQELSDLNQEKSKEDSNSVDYEMPQPHEKLIGVEEIQKEKPCRIRTETNDKKKQKSKTQLSKDEQLFASIDPATLYNSDPQVKYSPIREYQNYIEEQISCDICRDGENYDDDTIVLCDLCNSGAHQSCYGNDILDQIPQDEESWYCQRCRKLLNNPQMTVADIRCHFCNDLKGMMMQCLKNQIWAHQTCINYLPDVWFTDELKNIIDGKIFANERQTLQCYICRKKSTGACIQCDYKNCQQAFHVRCAMTKDIIKDWKTMNQQREDEEAEECFIFCEKHEEVGRRDLQNGGKARLQVPSEKVQIQQKLKKIGIGMTKSSNKSKKRVHKDMQEFIVGEDEVSEVCYQGISRTPKKKSSVRKRDKKSKVKSNHSQSLKIENGCEEDQESDDEQNIQYQNQQLNQNTAMMMLMQMMQAQNQQQIQQHNLFQQQPLRQQVHNIGYSKPQIMQQNGFQYYQGQQPMYQQGYLNGQQQAFNQYYEEESQDIPTIPQQNYQNPITQQVLFNQAQENVDNTNFQSNLKQALGLPEKSNKKSSNTKLSGKSTSTKSNSRQQTIIQPPKIAQNQSQNIQELANLPIPQIPGQAKINTFLKPKQQAPLIILPPISQQQQQFQLQNQLQQEQQNLVGQKRTHSTRQQKVVVNEDDKTYEVNEEFALLIGLDATTVARKDIQNAFISFSIRNELVELTSKCYQIYKNSFLRQKMGRDIVKPSDIFEYIQKAFCKKIE